MMLDTTKAEKNPSRQLYSIDRFYWPNVRLFPWIY